MFVSPSLSFFFIKAKRKIELGPWPSIAHAWWHVHWSFVITAIEIKVGKGGSVRVKNPPNI